jgi:hypothetical protein
MEYIYFIWLCAIIISILLGREIVIYFFLKVSEKDGRSISENDLMGVSHDVFQEIKVEDNMIIENVLSEDDFIVEYDNIFDEVEIVDDIDDIDDSVTQEGSIVGFEEIKQMIDIAGSDKPLLSIGHEEIGKVKQTIKQIEDTEFFDKMIRIKDDISRRIDDILRIEERLIA